MFFNEILFNNIESIKNFLKKGVDVNTKNHNGFTPLHIAVQNEQIDIVQLLVDLKADVNIKSSQGSTALHYAVEIGNNDIVKILLNGENCCVNATSIDGTTPLHIAAKKGSIRIVEDLLNVRASVNSVVLSDFSPEKCDGYTPLYFAVENGGKEVVKLLLKRGANVNDTAVNNLTPLHVAMKNGHGNIVKLLLRHGANVDAEDINCNTVLHLALKQDNPAIIAWILNYSPSKHNKNLLRMAVLNKGNKCKEIVSTLLRYGFEFDPETALNPDFFHMAVEMGCVEVVEKLLNHGVDVNLRKNNKTPLFYALENRNEALIELLLAKGADLKDCPHLLHFAVARNNKAIVERILRSDVDVNVKDKFGRTALHYVKITKKIPQHFGTRDNVHIIQREIAELLLNRGADVNAKTINDETILYFATEENNEHLVDALLKHNADVNVCTKQNKTPLLISVSNGNEVITRMLLNNGANINFNHNNPLHIAAGKGYETIVKTLLDFNADCDAKNANGRSPLDMAVEGGHAGVVETLLDAGATVARIYNIGSQFDLSKAQIEVAFVLLEYGVDVNILSRSYVRNNVGPSSACSFEELSHHIVKLKTAGFFVSDHNLRYINYAKSANIQTCCRKEMIAMANEQIEGSNVSYFDVLLKRKAYWFNEKVVQAIELGNYAVKFPMYANLIKKQFRRDMNKKELLKQSVNSFHKFIKPIPEPITEIILSCLSNKDLRNLISVGKI